MTRNIPQQTVFEMSLEIMGFQNQYPTVSLIIGSRFENFEKLNGETLNKVMSSRQRIFDKYVQKNENGFIMEQHEGQGRFSMKEEIRRTEFNNELQEWANKIVQVII